MFSSRDLKAVITEVRPIVERQLDDALTIASFRETVTTKGGDWSQVKALVKAMIQDERDDAGGHKRVLAILHKAGNALGYADMLGLGSLNEKNSFDEPEHDADGVIIEHRNIPASPTAGTNHGADDVATPPAHAPEQPGSDHGSVRALDASGAHASKIHEPDATMRPQTGGETLVDNSEAPVFDPPDPQGSVAATRKDAGAVASEPITEPTTLPPPLVVAAGDGDSAPSLAAVPVADRSKPNPWCLDHEECGLSSWDHFCLRCQRVKAERMSASAVQ